MRLVELPLGVPFPVLHPVRRAIEAHELVLDANLGQARCHADTLVPEALAGAVNQQDRRHVASCLV